jgi:hypothetical protein
LLEYNCLGLIALVVINIVHVISDRVRVKGVEQNANLRKLAAVHYRRHQLLAITIIKPNT